MRHLILIRHAIAEDREAAAEADNLSDENRALTEEGQRKIKKAAIGLWRLVPNIHAFATSPLLRAVETTEQMVRPFGRRPIIQLPELTPGGHWQGVLDWVRQFPADQWIACIGHEPDLSLLASWLLTGGDRPVLRLKKGAACLLELPDEPVPGTAVLLWSLTPAQLRQLGRAY